ncbi:MAG: cytochrome c [Bacteroidetes bacterium]|nr:cytochrome c [Bacteroidota bacterium]
MFNFHQDHKKLVLTSFIVFAGLSTLIAVMPAYHMQETKPLPAMQGLTEQEKNGLHIYVQENCVACHTQQVRNIEMDNTWGERPSMPSDYYFSKKRLDVWRQSPSLLGSERTGPDLTNIAKRQPGKEWHLMHFYNPRIVVEESIMPGYPWLFEEKNEKEVAETDVVVPIPAQLLKDQHNKVVATQNVLDLIAYLQSLKQAPLPGNGAPEFIPSAKKKEITTASTPADVTVTATATGPDGAKIYMNTCAACHQRDGKGLAGAFPSLAGSTIVNDNNHETQIKIILQGYDARAEYGVMTGFADQLNDEEITAVANHERTNWGNKGSVITAEEVKKIRESLKKLSQ